MKPIARAILALAWLLGVALPAAAIELPPSQSGVDVYDLAGIWSPTAIASAEATTRAIRERTQAEIAVVSIPTGFSSVDTGTARADAALVMDTWGVGRAGVNDGLVILFDMDATLRHGQIYLYTGSGFRDLYLSDPEAADIVDSTMLPRAKDGDLDAALLDGLARIDQAVQPGGNPARAGEAAFRLLVSAGVVALALVVLGLFLRTWWTRGRDARLPTIDDSVLLPAPPPDLTPAMATVLRKDGVDQEAFASALVDLGHRGLLTFAESKGLSFSHPVDLVVPDAELPDPASVDARRRPLGRAESALIDAIQAKAIGGVLESSRLRRGEGKKLFDAFKGTIGKVARDSGWFRDDPTRLTARWAGIGTVLAILAGVGFFFLVVDTSESSSALFKPGREFLAIPFGAAFLIGLGIALFGSRLAARTVDGAQTLAMALAYRNTLRFELAQSKTIGQAVERTTSRLPWITTPDELTVWAVALGLKHEIDELIKETFRTEPQGTGWVPLWYVGSGGFGSVGNVTNMLSSISTTSASSSGSGYGGGGSGGGGGAGGGF